MEDSDGIKYLIMKKLVILILLFSLVDCAHQTIWTLPPWKAMDDLEKDKLECLNYTEYHSWPIPFPISYYTHLKEYRSCMQKRGYVGRPGKMKWLWFAY
jgi:hypothetical protein